MPPSLGGESGVELAGLVEPPELGVAADRRPVDQDLRHRPAARELLETPRRKAGSSSSEDLLVRESPCPSRSAFALTQ